MRVNKIAYSLAIDYNRIIYKSNNDPESGCDIGLRGHLRHF